MIEIKERMKIDGMLRHAGKEVVLKNLPGIETCPLCGTQLCYDDGFKFCLENHKIPSRHDE